jgi:hypothetical protein
MWVRVVPACDRVDRTEVDVSVTGDRTVNTEAPQRPRRLVVLRAAAEVRHLCPPDLVEGRWIVVPGDVEDITIPTRHQGRPFMVKPTGRWERNTCGETAPVWEIAWDDFKVD